MGTASCKWVRPIFKTSWNSFSFLVISVFKWVIVVIRSSVIRYDAILMEVGIVSFVDCDMLTCVLGEQKSNYIFFQLNISKDLLAKTSLIFMFMDVPSPPWMVSTTN